MHLPLSPLINLDHITITILGKNVKTCHTPCDFHVDIYYKNTRAGYRGEGENNFLFVLLILPSSSLAPSVSVRTSEMLYNI